MSLAVARRLAETLLYEGYVLYPYRASAAKNRMRFQFGVVAPREYAERNGGSGPASVSGAAEAWTTRTECLLVAPPDADLRVSLRFLQLQSRMVETATDGGGFRPVASLEVDGELAVAFDEAVEHEVSVSVELPALRAGRRTHPFEASAGHDVESLGPAGRLVRRRQALSGVLSLSAEDLPGAGGLTRLRLDTTNLTPWGAEAGPGARRDEALRHSLVAAHSLVQVSAGRFVSLLDPPEWAAAAARACTNLHTWPVLVGPEDDVVLSAPIILYDHPGIAPESPGDLFDATEIDELLSLRTLALTDQEKAEARATDPRAGTIIERVEKLSGEAWDRLHGAVRRPASPRTDHVLVAGTAVSRGSRVRLRPRRREVRPEAPGTVRLTDAQDLFLEGKTARVEAVYFDLDGGEYLGVVLEDDPAADLAEWQGRFRYFRPDEVEPLDGER